MSGKRINDLSAPLAQANISIFYLSTYQTDFIFVSNIYIIYNIYFL